MMKAKSKEIILLNKIALYDQTLEEILLLNEAGNEFSRERIANGTLTPVFFGSALTNFGVQTFLGNLFAICTIATTKKINDWKN